MTDIAAAFLLIGDGRNQKQSLGEAAEALAMDPGRVRNIFYARTKPQPSEHERVRTALRAIADHQYRMAMALSQSDPEFFDADISAALWRANQARSLAE